MYAQLRLDIIEPQNRPTKLVFWYFFTFVCRNACSVALFTKSSNFVTLFCRSRSYKNRPHFCSTKLAYKIDENCFPFLGGPSEPDITGSQKPIAESVGNWHTAPLSRPKDSKCTSEMQFRISCPPALKTSGQLNNSWPTLTCGHPIFHCGPLWDRGVVIPPLRAIRTGAEPRARALGAPPPPCRQTTSWQPIVTKRSEYTAKVPLSDI